jgi:hypothetical protein
MIMLQPRCCDERGSTSGEIQNRTRFNLLHSSDTRTAFHSLERTRRRAGPKYRLHAQHRTAPAYAARLNKGFTMNFHEGETHCGRPG